MLSKDVCTCEQVQKQIAPVLEGLAVIIESIGGNITVDNDSLIFVVDGIELVLSRYRDSIEGNEWNMLKSKIGPQPSLQIELIQTLLSLDYLIEDQGVSYDEAIRRGNPADSFLFDDFYFDYANEYFAQDGEVSDEYYDEDDYEGDF